MLGKAAQMLSMQTSSSNPHRTPKQNTSKHPYIRIERPVCQSRSIRKAQRSSDHGTRRNKQMKEPKAWAMPKRTFCGFIGFAPARAPLFNLGSFKLARVASGSSAMCRVGVSQEAGASGFVASRSPKQA